MTTAIGATRALATWGRRHGRPLLGAAVGLLALDAPEWLARLRAAPVVLDERTEITLKLALGAGVAVALALAGLLARRRGRAPGRDAGFVLGAAASVAAVAWINFGNFHAPGFVHLWDQYHYHLGAKYFPELGYDGLYVASIGAQSDAHPGSRVAEYARDLRSYRVEPVPSLFPHMREVWRRFTPERWAAFVADNRYFVDVATFDQLGAWRLDHGYNATPAWTFVGRSLVAPWPTSHAVLVATGAVDLVLLAAAFALVFATFGSRVGCWTLVLLGFGYAGRFYWTGGSLLREDWLAATLAGLCMLERRRFATAGALVGYATMMRLFPALLLVGPALRAAREWREARAGGAGRPPVWARRLALGFAAAVVLGLAAGSAAGRGPGAWLEFSRAIRLHTDTWLTNNVGLAIPFLYDRAVLERRDVDWRAPDPWVHVQPRVEQHRRERHLAILAAQVALLALVALAAWRAPLLEATLAGLAVVFALLTPTAYYWIALVALPLARRDALVWGALGLNLALFALDLRYEAFEMRYGALSLGLGLLFAGWLAPDAARTALSAWRAWRSRQRTGEPLSAAS